LPPLVGANPPGSEASVTVSRDGKEKVFTVTLDALGSENGAVAAAGDQSQKSNNALGLSVERITREDRARLGNPEGGVVISEVESDVAWRAGLRPGDVILMINNRSIENLKDFETLVGKVEVGKAVALRVWRNGTSSFIAYTPREEGEN